MKRPHAAKKSRRAKVPVSGATSTVAESGSSPLQDIERAMVSIRRHMSKRSLGKLLAESLGESVDLVWLHVSDAVELGADPGTTEVTVGTVAERIGVDPSRASRMVSSAIKAGYIVRVASQRDGRRIGLALTDRGRAAVRQAHQVRQDFFGALLKEWTDRERADFARLLTRFVDRLWARPG